MLKYLANLKKNLTKRLQRNFLPCFFSSVLLYISCANGVCAFLQAVCVDVVVIFYCISGVTEELAIPTEPLLGIFRSLIQVLIQTSGSHQRVRANLYGSLLYYLQIGQRNDNRRESIGKRTVVGNSHYIVCQVQFSVNTDPRL